MGDEHLLLSPVSGRAYGKNGETIYWAEFTEDLVLLASAERDKTTNSPDQVNHCGRGVHVILDVTAKEGSPSIVLKIQGKDPASGGYYDILEGVAVTAVSTNVYKVHPEMTAETNVVAKDILPRTWRVAVIYTGTPSTDKITYSVGASVVR